MKILIIANNPKNIGGVMNYTRPLAIQFTKMGHKVSYLFSGTWDQQYNMFMMAYLRYSSELGFDSAEIINSNIMSYNYGRPEVDSKCAQIENLFIKYLDKIKPDVVHIHSRVGFPASINKIAYKKGIIVCNTIHTYGYICQKRVMIDYDGNYCLGPLNTNKCAVCTGVADYRKERFCALLKNYNKKIKNFYPKIFNCIQKIKCSVYKRRQPDASGGKIMLDSLGRDGQQLAERLSSRLKYCVDTLNNYSDCIVCVSNDVKNTLMRCGVSECKLFVQHIGSLIAEKQITNDQLLHSPIVVGNIGGVNHYKGIHVLVDAISKIKKNNFVVKIFGKYDKNYVSCLMEKYSDLPIEFTGRYRPEDLPEILKQIDVMVLPSICNDTAPQTIFESFSGGVPIIASDIGGFPDFVMHEKNGLLFEAGNSDDLAEKIDSVLSNPEQLVNYKKNILKLKTITENACELIALYNKLRVSRDVTLISSIGNIN